MVACICSLMFVCMYALACFLCLIWACDALEALVAPSRSCRCLSMEECCEGHNAILNASHATHTREVTNIYTTVKNTQTRHYCWSFVSIRFTKSSHVWREWNAEAASLLILCTAVTCWFFGGLPGPGVFRLSFVKEPQGPCRGWLEHTWQFELLGRSAEISPNWLWRLAVSLCLEMVCCCALCISWVFGGHGGRKGFFRNQWGGWWGQRPWHAAEEGNREHERCTIRPAVELFLELHHHLNYITWSPLPSFHLPYLCGGLHGQDTGNNNTVIPLHNSAPKQDHLINFGSI